MGRIMSSGCAKNDRITRVEYPQQKFGLRNEKNFNSWLFYLEIC